MKSEKKTYQNFKNGSLSVSCILTFIDLFKKRFISHRFDNTNTAKNYIFGLLKCEKGKANMERIEEEINTREYQVYQQFISNSNWDSDGLQSDIALQSSQKLEIYKQKSKLPTGYIIDESGHLKKGKFSVGVTRQYVGVSGKVDNAQVGVYSSLVNEKYATIINERLFLPKSWVEDIDRCEKAKIPKSAIVYKTKPELAYDMILQDIERGVKFDWIGGDGLYGHNTELCNKLDDLKQFYVLDVHKDETVYTERPTFSVPQKTSKRGRIPKNIKADKSTIRLDKLLATIKPKQWKLEKIRNTTKGELFLHVYTTTIWTWNKIEKEARQRTLIITKTTGKKPKVKYSLSNGLEEEYNYQEYAYFVSQRYWVERTFDNAKNELGMSDYQVRKWKSWHHHHSLVMLASLFLMSEQIDKHSEIPLLSFRDARILVLVNLFANKDEAEIILKQMKKRHIKRKKAIDFSYKKQRDKDKYLTS